LWGWVVAAAVRNRRKKSKQSLGRTSIRQAQRRLAQPGAPHADRDGPNLIAETVPVTRVTDKPELAVSHDGTRIGIVYESGPGPTIVTTTMVAGRGTRRASSNRATGAISGSRPSPSLLTVRCGSPYRAHWERVVQQRDSDELRVARCRARDAT
jgi:hypothetical protein